ncbi:hypothetical protein AKO1_005685 [Acrasis kona]|uniref:Uncharacterized protein n=1 Tax=Acrasis kona TaxID=1008807 RepID=A0AAW2YJ56_9EUKA
MHTPEAVNGSVRPSNAAVNHGTPQSNLVKIDPKTLLPQVDDLISNPTVRISSLDPSHTVLLEHSILPYIKSRNLQLTFNRRDLTKQTDNVNTPSDTEDMVVVRAERLVTHPNSKWCWKTVSSQYPTVPLFTNISPPHIIKSTSEGMMIDLSAVPSPSTQDVQEDTKVSFTFNAMCRETVINIFRFVVQNKSNPSMCERIMFTLNLSDSQAPESGIQYCNDITLEICRDVDPLWSWYWQDNKRALSQKNRVLSVMDMIPLEDKMNAEPQLILTPPQPVLTWEKPADMDFNQIAQHLSSLPDPSNKSSNSPPIMEATSPVTPNNQSMFHHNHTLHHVSHHAVLKDYHARSPAKLKSPRTSFDPIKSRQLPNINCKDITMQSLYEMIGSLSPTPTTPLSATGNFEWPSAHVAEKKNPTRRTRKPAPLSMSIDKNDKKNTSSPATQKQLTPFFISMMAADGQRDTMMTESQTK